MITRTHSSDQLLKLSDGPGLPVKILTPTTTLNHSIGATVELYALQFAFLYNFEIDESVRVDLVYTLTGVVC